MYAPFSGEYLDRLDSKILFMDCLKQHLTTLQRKKPTFLAGDINVTLTDDDIHPKEIQQMGGEYIPNTRMYALERTRFKNLTGNDHSIINDMEGKTQIYILAISQ